MEAFEAVEVEVLLVANEDVITQSSGNYNCGRTEGA